MTAVAAPPLSSGQAAEGAHTSTDVEYDAVIIGGGMGGLTTATQLAAKGAKVIVLEKCASGPAPCEMHGPPRLLIGPPIDLANSLNGAPTTSQCRGCDPGNRVEHFFYWTTVWGMHINTI